MIIKALRIFDAVYYILMPLGFDSRLSVRSNADVGQVKMPKTRASRITIGNSTPMLVKSPAGIINAVAATVQQPTGIDRSEE